MKRAALALTLACAGAASAQDFSLIPPIDCDLTQTCYIQQYMDRDPGPGVRDFRCGTLANDAHTGTDFALPSLALMHRGVPVIAAAPGRVAGIRDGMPDTGVTADTRDSIKGRECGNGVRLEHAGGYTTQYCHLREGSITVKPGQQVAQGDPLGLVGQSGLATFPHVHLSVRKEGKRIDPYAPDMQQACGAPGDPLWASAPPYRPGGLIAIGLSDRIPEYAAVKAGTAQLSAIAPDAPALAIWGYGFATRQGDVMRLTLSGPQGEIIAKDITLEKSQALSMRAIGKRLRQRRWPAGAYTGSVSLIREGMQLESRTITLQTSQ